MGYGCFKASETLLGIETTKNQAPLIRLGRLQSLWNPFRDWNATNRFGEDAEPIMGFKASETLLGIETNW